MGGLGGGNDDNDYSQYDDNDYPTGNYRKNSKQAKQRRAALARRRRQLGQGLRTLMGYYG